MLIYVSASVDDDTIQARAVLKHPLAPIGVYAGHVAAPQRQRRDEPQHIAQALHGGELTVGRG